MLSEKGRSQNTGEFNKIHHMTMASDLLASDLGKLFLVLIFSSFPLAVGPHLDAIKLK